ncbi:hypothetical protein [Streptomyces laurentii]|uniref:hypothetical protein n=1 Tax=Streptomyces laurentii TaxID=39478 RepID=UPI0036B9C0F1
MPTYPTGHRVRGLRGELETVEHGTVYVKVTYETRSLDQDSGCTGTRRVEATVQTAFPGRAEGDAGDRCTPSRRESGTSRPWGVPGAAGQRDGA